MWELTLQRPLVSGVAMLAVVLLGGIKAPLRRQLRPWVISQVESGLKWVVWCQKIRHPVLTSIHNLSSRTVSIEFYVLFLPFAYWCGEWELVCVVLLALATCCFTSNFAKDLFCAPRPFAVENPRYKKIIDELVQNLGGFDVVHSREYGLPSSHTSLSLTMNMCFLHQLGVRGIIPSELMPWCYFAAALWVGWIAFGRMYGGMHSPIDIVAGTATGLASLSFVVGVKEMYTQGIRTGPTAWQVQLVVTLVLLVLYPKPLQPTPSRNDAIKFAAASVGLAMGATRAHQMVELAAIQTTAASMLGGGWLKWALRPVVGLPLCVLLKEATKAAAIALLPQLLQALPKKLPLLSVEPRKFVDPIASEQQPYSSSVKVQCFPYTGGAKQRGSGTGKVVADATAGTGRVGAQQQRHAEEAAWHADQQNGHTTPGGEAKMSVRAAHDSIAERGLESGVQVCAMFLSYMALTWGVAEGSLHVFSALGIL